MAARPGAAGETANRREARGLDPFHALWKLLTNIKIAVLLVGIIAAACMVGVLIPQMPGEMRGNPAAQSAWLEAQRADFGWLTDTMERLQLFEVFYSIWFNALWLILMFAMTVATVSRIRPVDRTVRRPPKRVNDRYFDAARYRTTIAGAQEPEAIEAVLRKRHYKVERIATENGATFLFADRYPWAYYGTFISHLALLLLLVGGLLTRFVGFDRTLIAAETAAPAPVFGETRADQIFIGMVDAIERVDEDGNIIDYRSHLQVTQGDKVITCTTTVNDPCNAFGYSIHQAAFIDDLARVRITDPDGGVVFNDLLDFGEGAASVPHLRITNAAGNVLFDQEVPQQALDLSDPEDVHGYAAVTFRSAPGSAELKQYAAEWLITGDQMLVLIGGDPLLGDPPPMVAGESVTSNDGYTVEFVEHVNIPAVTYTDLPGTEAEDGLAVVQMPKDPAGTPYLYMMGLETNEDGQPSPVVLQEGETLTTDAGYTYTFERQVDASGMSVKRDPGDMFIWIAVGLATVGLGITFYVPRRRLWAKILPERTQFAGMAERTTRFERELDEICADLGDPREPAQEE